MKLIEIYKEIKTEIEMERKKLARNVNQKILKEGGNQDANYGRLHNR